MFAKKLSISAACIILLLAFSSQAQANLVEKFSCRGAYTDVEFSEDSGDASGVFFKVDQSGIPKFFSYEGGVFIGQLRLELDTEELLIMSVTFSEFDGYESILRFRCENGQLKFESKNWGTKPLRRISAEEEFELTNGVG